MLHTVDYPAAQAYSFSSRTPSPITIEQIIASRNPAEAYRSAVAHFTPAENAAFTNTLRLRLAEVINLNMAAPERLNVLRQFSLSLQSEDPELKSTPISIVAEETIAAANPVASFEKAQDIYDSRGNYESVTFIWAILYRTAKIVNSMSPGPREELLSTGLLRIARDLHNEIGD